MEITIKGILHCHSNYSYDAKLSLPELKELCKKNNIQFVCMTEHADELSPDRAQAFVAECESLCDESFLFIPGFEVPYRKAHVLMVGQRDFFGNYASNSDALRIWTKDTPFVVLAHPVRNHFSVDDGLLSNIHALEVWNQQYEGKRVPRTRSLSLLEALRAQKQELLATGGVDFHRTEHMGPPFVTLQVEVFTESEILEKMKLGAYSVSSPQAFFYGTLPNAPELKRKYRWESFMAVSVITAGKFINKVLAAVGISLPKSLKQLIRKKV